MSWYKSTCSSTEATLHQLRIWPQETKSALTDGTTPELARWELGSLAKSLLLCTLTLFKLKFAKESNCMEPLSFQWGSF